MRKRKDRDGRVQETIDPPSGGQRGRTTNSPPAKRLIQVAMGFAISSGVSDATLPKWITKESIAETLAVWQPYNKERLTEADAVEMLMNVRRLAEVLCRARQAQRQAA